MINELEMERIFSYAAALEQSGRQKNSIHCWENIVYILNSDKTLLLKFESLQNLFPNPIGFFANDYDSPNFRAEGNSIIFLQKGEEFLREKKCRIPNISFSEVEDLFYKFHVEANFKWNMNFHKESLSLLNEELSHIEFSVKDHKVIILQRDIYSGTIIKLERKPEHEGLGLVKSFDQFPESLPPIGMRTNDFLSLFNFNDKIIIQFTDYGKYFGVQGMHNNMLGIVAGCLYDSIGFINEIKGEENGREEQKIGNSQQKVDRADTGQVLRKRIK